MTTARKTITSLARIRSSKNGNPTYSVAFDDGTVALTETDASIGYSITNTELHRVPVLVDFNRAGRITDVIAVPDGKKVRVKISQYLKVMYLHGWVVMWEDGSIVEHSLPSQAAAEERLAFHVERVNVQQAWDDAHRRES